MLLAPIVEIFCDIDDFCKDYSKNQAKKRLPLLTKKTRKRPTSMSESEIMILLVLFHLSHYRTFKEYYWSCVLEDLSALFPNALSYTRFVALTGRVLEPLTAYVLSKAREQTNLYYIDSTKLVACHNKRISGHKVFKGNASDLSVISKLTKNLTGLFFGDKGQVSKNVEENLFNQGLKLITTIKKI